jgi:aspartate carbamoyltransferase catalytic subunit
LVAPPTLLPVGVEQWPVKIVFGIDDVLGQVDVIMMLRIQRERMTDLFFPSEREYSRQFGLDSDRLRKIPKTLIMHPGPMNRGLEISAESADSVNSVIVEQVTNGVHIRMAVLYLLLGGAQRELLTAVNS